MLFDTNIFLTFAEVVTDSVQSLKGLLLLKKLKPKIRSPHKYMTDMNIFSFTESFPDENSCIAHFKALREQNKVICRKCGSEGHYWLRNKLSQ